jgi:autotransporter-associated beta strand protein
VIRDRLARQSRRGLRDLGRIAHCAFRGGAMRTHLLTTAAAAALLAAMPAHAQNATWTGSTSGDWNTNGNWSTATVPTGTATFDTTGLNQSLNISASASINTLLFAAGAPAYSYAINSGARFDIVGAGIINNSSNAPSFSLTTVSILAFSNNSTAGNAVIANNGFNSVTTFSNSSTAGTATITNTGFGSTTFNNSSTAGNASITSALSGFVSFLGSSTAGNATITTNFGGTTFFNSNTTAGNATVVTNNGGSTQFSAFSTGGNASFITQAGGVFDMSALITPAMTAGSIEGQGTYFLGSNALIVGGNNLSTTVAGTISDSGASGGTGGSLVKVGTGTLTLAGINSYTGVTIVNGGTLSVTGDISSSSGVLVTPGGMLAGTGTAPGVLVGAEH